MDSVEEQMEDLLIEKQIEDELQTLNELEADMSTEQKAAYAHLSEGMMMAKERIVLIKNIISDYKYDDEAVIENYLEDAAVIRKSSDPKTVGYDNDELVEVILDLQKKAEKDNE